MKGIWMLVTIAGLSAAGIGCGEIEENPQDAVQAQTQPANRPVAVDVAIARSGSLATEVEYAGTTAPIREVSVRSRLEGRLLNLNVDIGDRVSAGQAIAQLDNAELFATVLQTEAEIAARRAEVAQANAAVGNARSQAERARLEYRQARADANRFSQLAKQGAVSKQVAENALTQARAAEQIFFASEQQVRLQQQTVGAAAQRVAVQQAIRLREQERQSYTIITAPIDGVVLERMSETGNLLFAGNEVLKLGIGNQPDSPPTTRRCAFRCHPQSKVYRASQAHFPRRRSRGATVARGGNYSQSRRQIR
jgi:HlyD family secretion protein